MANLYFASKLRHGFTALRIEKEWHEHKFVSSWTRIDSTIPDDPEHAAVFWPRNIRDVMASDVVLVYAEEGDNLRGAVFEAGVGYATNKLVFLCGPRECFGTWQYNHNIRHLSTLDKVRWAINHMLPQELCSVCGQSH